MHVFALLSTSTGLLLRQGVGGLQSAVRRSVVAEQSDTVLNLRVLVRSTPWAAARRELVVCRRRCAVTCLLDRGGTVLNVLVIRCGGCFTLEMPGLFLFREVGGLLALFFEAISCNRLSNFFSLCCENDWLDFVSFVVSHSSS